MEEEIQNHPPSEEENKTTVSDKPTDTVDLIAKANEAAARLEAANTKNKKIVAELQKMQIEQILSGKTVAGKQEKSEEQIKEENARKMLEGTGMEEYAFPNAKTDNSYN